MDDIAPPGHKPISRRAAISGLTAGAATLGFARPSRAATGYQIRPDIVVAKDGSGDFTTVQAALRSIPKDNRERRIILVRDGVYNEAVRVDAAYVTLRGESRQGTRLALNRPASLPRDEIGPGVLNTLSTAHDLVVETLTIHNTVEAIGPHAFAVMGRSDRIIIQDADLLSLGADTLALWRTTKTTQEAGLSSGPGASPLTEDGGRYYHRNLRVTGSVDFVCPRGWCFMTDSQIEQVNPAAEAAFWHEGSNVAEKKFVIRNTRVDGPPEFYLARAHRDAQFYFVGCAFSERTRDKPPYHVVYPLNGGPPSEKDIESNLKAQREMRFGVRSYFHDTHRAKGDFAWMADSLDKAAGAPKPDAITAKWTFGGTWDPETRDGPRVVAVHSNGDRIALEFDVLVTVKGAPELALADRRRATYASGSGSNRLEFQRPSGGKAAAPSQLVFERGVVIRSEAVASLTPADPRLPRA